MLVRVGNSAQLQQLGLACNTGDAGLFSNIRKNTRRGLDDVRVGDAMEQVAVIVGGGPSLADTLESIKELKTQGAKIYALNNAAKYLADHGIRPDAQIMVDPRALNSGFIGRWVGEVYLASQCDPVVFDRCAEVGVKTHVYHAMIENMAAFIYRPWYRIALQWLYERVKVRALGLLARPPHFIGGGLTVGLTGLCLVYTLGHREIHLFGYDSCHSEEKSHAYRQDANVDDEIVHCCVNGRTFRASTTMAAQADAFPNVYTMLHQLGCKIEVYGDGLIPHLFRYITHVPKVLTAVYDLGLSPPSYDFIAFLCEAEKARIEKGLEQIDVIFQPGPMRGFRNDDLPPSYDHRAGMLSRICVAACRLLPSVRNVEVLSDRKTVQGVMFPEGYTEAAPMSHYGIGYFKNALPCLRATQSARQYVAAHIKGAYATITLREADYWPERNSNKPEWVKVAQWLSDRRIEPIFVPDVGGEPTRTFRNFHEAIDIDLRMALYEGAVINLGISNGPVVLLYASESPYLIFRPLDESCPSTSEAFLASHGIHRGDSYAGRGKLVWEADTFEVIVRELERFLVMEKVA